MADNSYDSDTTCLMEDAPVEFSHNYENWEKYSSSRFHTIGFISQGGVKSIYKVKDKICGRYLAMAMLSDFSPSEQIKSRFIYEARITAILEHPNIVPVHEIGFNKSKNPYFTMKLVGGENLGLIIKHLADDSEEYSQKFSLNYLLDIFIQACNAIAFAHSKNILHLDLKPENIQVGDFGEVLVLDWGLAKFIGDKNVAEFYRDFSGLHKIDKEELESMASVLNEANCEATLDGAVKGSPGYMAPEQASGWNSKRDKRTDIYSLGAILYSILTLEKPVEGRDVQEVLTRTAAGDIVKPLARNRNRYIPAALNAITEKAMALEPENRYHSVQELIDDVTSYKNGYATSVESSGLFRQLYLLLKRRKEEAFILIISMLILLIFFTVSFIKVNESREIAQEQLQKVRQQRAALRASIRKLRSLRAEHLLKNKKKLKKVKNPD